MCHGDKKSRSLAQVSLRECSNGWLGVWRSLLCCQPDEYTSFIRKLCNLYRKLTIGARPPLDSVSLAARGLLPMIRSIAGYRADEAPAMATG